jgi:hypothetical protein
MTFAVEDSRSMLEDIANSRYLMRAYAQSSDSWEHFRTTAQQASLFEVAAILCGAWTVLGEDDDFFDGVGVAYGRLQELEVLAGVPSKDVPKGGAPLSAAPRADQDLGEDDARVRDEFRAHLEVDRLLSRELVVLVHAGMKPVHAVRLVTDLADVLGDELRPRTMNLEDLRADITKFAAELCEAETRLRVFSFDPEIDLTAARPPHRGWLSRLKRLRRRIIGIGGAATVAADVAALVTGPGLVSGLGLASIVGGMQALHDGLYD